MRRSVGTIKKPVPKARATPTRSSPTSIVTPCVRVDRSWRARHPKKSLVVVLDIDHTLVATTNAAFSVSHPDRRYVLDLDGISVKGSTRPDVTQFLSFLEDYAREVVIWTAGVKEYAEAVVDLLYEDRAKPRVYHREHCSVDDQGRFHKPISDLAKKLDVDPEAILIIDDMPHTFQSNPSNGVLIPEYHGNDNDTALGKIYEWMESPHVRHSWSATQLDKEYIFNGSVDK